MTETYDTSYDELPYPGHTFPHTHPDHLATAAVLSGLMTLNPDHCRVLELGCGDGSNLIPMAESLPKSTFVGIDFARTHIDAGRRVIEEARLSNIQLHHMDLREYSAVPSSFDYIICHGVYSWVPTDVQQAILDICSKCLSDIGVAFISYNTYPGWHQRGAVRDMLCQRDNPQCSAASRISTARAFLAELAEVLSKEVDPYSGLLLSEVSLAQQAVDHHFFHEYLETVNEPIYLQEFIDRTTAHGLHYLCDAELSQMLPTTGVPHIERFLGAVDAQNLATRSQHLDFLTNRVFRRSLICRDDQHLGKSLNPETCGNLFVTTGARPKSSALQLSDVQLSDAVELHVQTMDGRSVVITTPLIKASLMALMEVSPGGLMFDDLVVAARTRLGMAGKPDEESAHRRTLLHWLIGSHSNSPASLIHLSCHQPRFVAQVNSHPMVSRVTRLQAQSGRAVSNRRHERLGTDATYRRILPLLDGTRDLQALTQIIDSNREHLLPLEGESSHDMTLRYLRNFAHLSLLTE